MIPLLLLAPFLAGHTTATQALKRHYDDNNAAFIPGTTPGCPDDWLLCGDSDLCYNPDLGQICCPGGTYACPSNSFCFVAPYCCPNDMTPESCAHEYGFALATSDLSNPSQGPDKESDSETGNESDGPIYPRPTPRSTSASSITISSTPIPTPLSSFTPWPAPSSVSASPSPSVSEAPTYTGAASGLALGRVLGAAVVVVAGILNWR